MRKTTNKTRADLLNQDLLNFQELVVYISGISPEKLRQCWKRGLLPEQRVPGKWSRHHIDAWLGKGGAPESYQTAINQEITPMAEKFLQELGENLS